MVPARLGEAVAQRWVMRLAALGDQGLDLR